MIMSDKLSRQDLSDKEIIEKCLNGETGYFEGIVERYERMIYSICLSYLRNIHDSEDAVHDTFLRAYTSLRKLRKYTHLGKWLGAIATSVSIDRLRKKKVRKSAEKQLRENPAPDTSGEDTDVQAEQTRKMIDLLQGLPREQRLPISMHYIGGLSYKEISEKTGQPLSTVRSRIYEGKKVLRKRLNL